MPPSAGPTTDGRTGLLSNSNILLFRRRSNSIVVPVTGFRSAAPAALRLFDADPT